MNVEAVATKFENAVIDKFWLRLMLALFVAAPLLIFLMWWEQHVFVAWVFAAEVYVVAWLVRFFSKASGERKALVFARTTLALLSPIVWGGVFATIYIFIYAILMLLVYGFPK